MTHALDDNRPGPGYQLEPKNGTVNAWPRSRGLQLMIMKTAPTGQNSRVGRRLHDYICRLGDACKQCYFGDQKGRYGENLKWSRHIHPVYSCTPAQLTETSRFAVCATLAKSKGPRCRRVDCRRTCTLRRGDPSRILRERSFVTTKNPPVSPRVEGAKKTKPPCQLKALRTPILRTALVCWPALRTRAGQQTVERAAPNAIAISCDTLDTACARERYALSRCFIFAGGTKSVQHDCPSAEGGEPRRSSPMKTSFLYSTALLLLIGGDAAIAQSPDISQKREESPRAQTPAAQSPAAHPKGMDRPAAADRTKERAQSEQKGGAKEMQRGEAPSRPSAVNRRRSRRGANRRSRPGKVRISPPSPAASVALEHGAAEGRAAGSRREAVCRPEATGRGEAAKPRRSTQAGPRAGHEQARRYQAATQQQMDRDRTDQRDQSARPSGTSTSSKRPGRATQRRARRPAKLRINRTARRRRPR